MNLDTMRLLVGKGLSAADLLEVAETMAIKVDRTAAERQARHRAKVQAERDAVTRDVTRDCHSDTVTDPALSRPPNEENLTPPPIPTRNNISARAKADDFPCPEGVDPTDWLGLKANRKAKRAALTVGAHRQIIRKLEGWARDGWPPGPIVAAAVERGWTTVFETDEMKAPRNGRLPAQNSQPSLRGSRPDPALDMLYQAQRELQAEAERENPRSDRPPRLALPAN